MSKRKDKPVNLGFIAAGGPVADQAPVRHRTRDKAFQPLHEVAPMACGPEALSEEQVAAMWAAIPQASGTFDVEN